MGQIEPSVKQSCAKDKEDSVWANPPGKRNFAAACENH